MVFNGMFCGFNLHFPDGYEAEHLFMCLFTIHLLFLWKKLCRYFSSFIDLFVLLLRCKISLYILYPSFCHICVLEIFFPSLWFNFIFLSIFQRVKIEIEVGEYTHRHKFNFVGISTQIMSKDPIENIMMYFFFFVSKKATCY